MKNSKQRKSLYKVPAMLSGILLTLSLLAGCGTNAATISTTTTTTTSTTTTTFPTRTSNQLDLDGNNQYVRETTGIASPSVLDASTFTIEAWIFPVESKTMTIVSDSAYSLDVVSQNGQPNNGLGIRWTLFNAARTAFPSSVEFRDLVLHQWNHVAGMYDNTTNTCSVAINGVVSTTTACITSGALDTGFDQLFGLGTPNAGTITGAGAVTNSMMFNGRVDEVRLSDIVRYTNPYTPEDSFTGPEANTLGLWHFEESAGSTSFADSSTHGHTLTGINGATTTEENLSPVAALSVTPSTGNAPLDVTADASGSNDPDGTIASYRFDFGDGTIVGPQASATANHQYAVGNWTVILIVTDNNGAIGSTSVQVTVADLGSSPNLIGNPSFESNTNGWVPFGGSSIQRVADGFDGAFSLEVTGPATRAAFGINDSPNWVAPLQSNTAGTRYRFTAWVKSATSNGAARLRIREFKNNVKVGTTANSILLALSPSWQMITVDYVTVASQSTLDLQVLDFPVVGGDVFDVDNISIRIVP